MSWEQRPWRGLSGLRWPAFEKENPPPSATWVFSCLILWASCANAGLHTRPSGFHTAVLGFTLDPAVGATWGSWGPCLHPFLGRFPRLLTLNPQHAGVCSSLSGTATKHASRSTRGAAPLASPIVPSVLIGETESSRWGPSSE